MANTPINIADLQRGAVVRVQLSAGFVAEVTGPGVAQVAHNVVARPYRRSMVIGSVMRNDFAGRQVSIDFTDTMLPNQHFLITVPYGRIMVIEKQVPGGTLHAPLRIPAYVPVLGVF